MPNIKQHTAAAVAVILTLFTFAATIVAVALNSEAWAITAMASATPLALALIPRPAAWRRGWARLKHHHAQPRRVQREMAQHAEA